MAELSTNTKFTETTEAVELFSNLNETAQRRLLEQKNIIFQGAETNLKELLSPLDKVDLDDVIDSEVIAKLDKNENIKVGRELQSPDDLEQACYIPRRIRKSCDPYPEEELCDLGGPKHDDLVCIGDVTGSGRSTFITNIARTIKKKSPNYWVLKVDLDKYGSSFRDFKKLGLKSITLLELLDSKPETRMRSTLERKVFSIPDKVVILLDGINEVCLEYKHLLLSLIRDCRRRNRNEYFTKYTVNLLVLIASPNLQKELGWEVTHFLEPFSREDQVEFLKRYWGKKFKTDSDKCEIYAKKVVNSEWLQQVNKSVGYPLILRIIAEVLENSNSFDDGTSKWEGCYDFLISNNTEPTLPMKTTVVELFQVYIRKNCSEDARSALKSVRSDITLLNSSNDSLLYNVALQSILDEKRCKNFSCYISGARGISGDTVMKFKIIKNTHDELHFTHRAFADYFLADCIHTELTRHQKEPLLKFLFEEVLVDDRYKVVRLFFNSFMLTDLESMPNDTLKTIGKVMVETDYNLILCTGAKEGLLGVLKFVLECSRSEYVDINSARVKEGHAIHFAAQCGYLDIVQFFIDNGTKVNTRNQEDRTTLHLAAKSGSFPMVKFLIECGAKIDCKDAKGHTPLHVATRRGSLDMMKYLIERGAYVNSRSKWGYTPLHIAAWMGDIERVEYLVQIGAEINSRGEYSGTVISTAVLSCNLDVVKYLVEKGADVLVRNKSGGTMLQLLPKWAESIPLDDIVKLSKFLLDKGVDINSTNHYGETALHTAIKRNYPVEFVRFLVENGSNVNVISKFGETPLSEAISRNELDIIKYLMENGVLLNNVPNLKEKVFESIRQGFVAVVKYFGEKGVPIVVRDDGSSTLDMAFDRDDLEMIKLLVQKGAKISKIETLKEAIETCSIDTVEYLLDIAKDITLKFGEVALKNLELAKFLIEKGATFESVSDVGDNLELLQYLFDKSINVDETKVFLKAAQSGNLTMVKLLHQKGIDVNVRDCDGMSGLRLAAYRNHVSIIKYLIKHNADMELKDNEGTTPLNVATRNGCLESVRVLLGNGADIKSIMKPDDNALKEAIDRMHIETARYLVEQGAQVGVKCEVYLSPLTSALHNDEMELAETLAEHDPNFKCSLKQLVKQLLETGDEGENQGRTLVDSIFSNLKAVNYLIEGGLELDIPTIDKYNLLAKAVTENDFKLVRYLIKKGCDLESKDYCGHTTLHECADLNMMKLLVENGADVNSKPEHGYTILHRAIEKSNFDVVDYLIEKGAKVDDINQEGCTLLHMKIYEWGYISIDKIKHLIEKGASLRITKKGRNVLHDAVASSHIDLDMVKHLLKLGVDINLRDHDGKLPLDDAIAQGDLDVVKVLVEHGTEIDKDDRYTGVLFNAIQSHHHGGWDSSLDMVKYLVDKGANINARKDDGSSLLQTAITERHTEIVKFLIKNGVDVNAADKNGNTLLHEAASRSEFTLIKLLVDSGANLEAKTSTNRTILHEAAASGCLNTVKFFIENGAGVNATDTTGHTPLYEASGSIRSDISVLKYLLDQGAEVNVRTRKGHTPLHQSSAICDLNKVRLLVENGADVNAKDEYGRTAAFAFVMAYFRNRTFLIVDPMRMIRFLIDSGANLEERADDGRTILHEAARVGNLQMVECLVGLGADVNAKSLMDRTPLHEAAVKGVIEVVEYLVKSGVDVEAKMKKGRSALDEAIAGKHEEVVEFLKKTVNK